jgi:hypothetical protein
MYSSSFDECAKQLSTTLTAPAAPMRSPTVTCTTLEACTTADQANRGEWPGARGLHSFSPEDGRGCTS